MCFFKQDIHSKGVRLDYRKVLGPIILGTFLVVNLLTKIKENE